jgi:predicted MFS family arabinose efflux permease
MVLAASGVGGALGSVVASRLLARVRYSWIRIQTSVWFLGFAVLALLAGRQVILMAVVMAILGFTGALGNIELDTHLMRNVEKDMLARITSISRLMSFGACAIGPALGGILVQGFGVQHAMSCLFFITPVLLLLSAIIPSVPGPQSHSLDRPEVAVPDSAIPVGQS